MNNPQFQLGAGGSKAKAFETSPECVRSPNVSFIFRQLLKGLIILSPLSLLSRTSGEIKPFGLGDVAVLRLYSTCDCVVRCRDVACYVSKPEGLDFLLTAGANFGHPPRDSFWRTIVFLPTCRECLESQKKNQTHPVMYGRCVQRLSKLTIELRIENFGTSPKFSILN
jgi:hypothetical protein